ncbi:MAG: prepilin peptidase [Actinobacteria bacterium]|nr:prepilin peptidase [Actinomycetota bacterium]
MTPNVALAAIVFAPALALGSFLNVVVARLPERRSLVRPRSACPACAHELAWHDNVPLVSYALLRGHCRSCTAPISLRYPLVELATAFLVAACFWRFGLSGQAFVAAFFVAVLVTLSAIDAERRILPDLIVLPATAIVLVAQIALFPDRALEWVVASLAASLFLFVALVAYPAGMGMGDVKLALLLGAALGWNVSVGMMLGMLFAMAAATVLIARHGAKARKMAIPFGPFLALGAIVALFAGGPIFDAYLRLF